MLFPYEDVVKFFQCEEEYIYPRGLFNCGNRYALEIFFHLNDSI